MKNSSILTRVLMILALFISTTKIIMAQTSISVKETNKYYKYKASYDSTQTSKVQDYLNANLKHSSDFSFKNGKIDVNVTLYGGMYFFMHNAPGDLEFNFDKKKNKSSDLDTLKKVCDALKNIMNDN